MGAWQQLCRLLDEARHTNNSYALPCSKGKAAQQTSRPAHKAPSLQAVQHTNRQYSSHRVLRRSFPVLRVGPVAGEL